MTVLKGEEQVGAWAVNDVAGPGTVARQPLVRGAGRIWVELEVFCKDIVHAEGGVELEVFTPLLFELRPAADIVQRTEVILILTGYEQVPVVFVASAAESTESKSTVEAAGEFETPRQVEPGVECAGLGVVAVAIGQNVRREVSADTEVIAIITLRTKERDAGLETRPAALLRAGGNSCSSAVEARERDRRIADIDHRSLKLERMRLGEGNVLREGELRVPGPQISGPRQRRIRDGGERGR